MNRITFSLLTLALSLAPVLCWAAEPNADQAKAIAEMKQLGGKPSASPGTFVAATTDGDSAPVTKKAVLPAEAQKQTANGSRPSTRIRREFIDAKELRFADPALERAFHELDAVARKTAGPDWSYRPYHTVNHWPPITAVWSRAADVNGDALYKRSSDADRQVISIRLGAYSSEVNEIRDVGVFGYWLPKTRTWGANASYAIWNYHGKLEEGFGLSFIFGDWNVVYSGQMPSSCLTFPNRNLGFAKVYGTIHYDISFNRPPKTGHPSPTSRESIVRTLSSPEAFRDALLSDADDLEKLVRARMSSGGYVADAIDFSKVRRGGVPVPAKPNAEDYPLSNDQKKDIEREANQEVERVRRLVRDNYRDMYRAARMAFPFTAALAKAVEEPKPSADHIRQLDRMIDAMASRNKAPAIVRTQAGDEALALFSPDFDWSDQDRVQKAIRAVREDKSDEMWWRLRDHIGDKRYALTADFDDRMAIWNISVGEYCLAISEANLKAAYARHLPRVSGRMPFNFAVLSEENRTKWAGKPLYELQIEVCEEAIEQMASIKATEACGGGDYRSPSHTFTADERAQFVSALKKQVEELKRTKTAVTTDHIALRGFGAADLYHFNAANAKEMRETYEREKSGSPKGGKGQ